ncbi:MAG TPA: hypothetical protein VII28_16570 [Puia sp.]
MAPQIKYFLNADKSLHPDKKARVSLVLGVSAILFMLFPSYTLMLEILPGILAIRYGRVAIKNGTAKKATAFSGQVLGIIVLSSLIMEIVLALMLLLIRHAWE